MDGAWPDGIQRSRLLLRERQHRRKDRACEKSAIITKRDCVSAARDVTFLLVIDAARERESLSERRSAYAMHCNALPTAADTCLCIARGTTGRAPSLLEPMWVLLKTTATPFKRYTALLRMR